MQLAFDWVGAHLNMLGWGFVLTIAIRFVRFIALLEARFGKVEQTLEQVATNHLAHIEQSMASVDENMRGLREDMKELRGDMRDFSLYNRAATSLLKDR